MRLFVRPSPDRAEVYPYIAQLSAITRSCGGSLLFHEKHRKWVGELGDEFCEDRGLLLERCDAVVALGGDGTIIHAAKFAAEAGKPVLGINAGNLGFTASLEGSEITSVRALFSGEYSLQPRLMLDVAVIDAGGKTLMKCHAMNEAVVSRGTLARIVDMRVFHDGRLAIDFRADGLIVSTPTGSTGYSLSSGGPIIDPELRCLTLTPICPHSLRTRPIIFGSSALLTVEIEHRTIEPPEVNEVFLCVDGETSLTLMPGNRVVIRESDITADFIIIKPTSFSEVMREKLYNR